MKRSAINDVEMVRRVLLSRNEQAARAVVAEFAADQSATLWRQSRPWFKSTSIVGLEIGLRTRRGVRGSAAALRILVVRKGPQVGASTIPSRLPVPGTRRSVLTDVEGIGRCSIDVDERFSSRRRPAEAGIAIGAGDSPPATFACLVQDAESGQRFLLSNSHVLANFGRAKPGLSVYQPGSFPRRASSVVATLALSIEIKLDPIDASSNRADAAIAAIVDPLLLSSEIFEIGAIRRIATAAPTLDTVVRKFGPATGLTASTVVATGVSMQVGWRDGNGRSTKAWFHDLVRCRSFTDRGDSGAAVVDSRNQLLGLHMASSDFSSFFVPIHNVIEAFREQHGVQLVVVQ